MTNLKHLIPKDKHDISAVEKLVGYSFDEIEPIVPDLLEWLQDINWPVAKPIAKCLLAYTERLTPYLLEILKTSDGMWKYWCLDVFFVGSKTQPSAEIKAALHRIVQFPSNDELEDEVYLLATEILHEQKNF